MKAMIFAAGLGTRLKPITDTMPKALVPICEKPLLGHVLDKLKAAGIDDMTVNVHHFAEQIVAYLENNSEAYPGVKVSDETGMLLETGGAIRHAKPLLKAKGENKDKRFIVHNVDIISNLDLQWFEQQWKEGALANLLVSERTTSRYFLFNQENRLVGWTNVSTGEVLSSDPELDVDSCKKLAFSGIHMISDEIFDAMNDVDEAPVFYPLWKWYKNDEGKLAGPVMTGGDPLGERFSIVDFYLRVSDEYPIYGVQAKELRLIDVGKFDTLSDAENLCRELMK